MRTLARLAAALSYIVVFASIGAAETTGEISGHIRYLGGKPIAGIHVRVCSAGQVAVTTTDARGFYSFVSLAPDRYALSFVAPTKMTFVVPGLRVLADELTTQDSYVSPSADYHIDVAGQPSLQALTSADVSNFDADDVNVDRSKSCSYFR